MKKGNIFWMRKTENDGHQGLYNAHIKQDPEEKETIEEPTLFLLFS